MFKCNLTGVNYTYENFNLLELREKLITQFNLKPWDIYAGYSEKSEIDYTPDELVRTDPQEPWKLKLSQLIQQRGAETAALKQQDIDNITEKLATVNKTILELAKQQTGVDLTSYEAYRTAHRHILNIPSLLINEADLLHRMLSDIRIGLGRKKYEANITPLDLKLFEDDRLFIQDIKYTLRGNVVTAHTLLNKFDFRTMISTLDYCERNNLSLEDRIKAFRVDTTKEYAECIDIFDGNDYPEFRVKSSILFDSLKYGLYKKVPSEDIYAYIVEELNKYAERTIEMDKDVYYQQVDITPITINVTPEGKFELLDGYKRLLYMNDAELLNITAPIKVFTHLSDKDFIRLLYSANAWKTVGSRGIGPFHDRGFIFALRQRFGVRFEDYFHNSWKDIDLLKLLQLYDAPTKYCLYNKYMVSDMKALAKLNEITMPFFKEEENRIYRKIIRISVKLLGELRRAYVDVEQNDINFNELLTTVLSSKTLTKKIASKENMSVDGHIENFMADHVTPVLKSAIKKALGVDTL